MLGVRQLKVLVALLLMVSTHAFAARAPLLQSIIDGDTEAARQLLENGADMNEIDADSGYSSILTAASYNRIEILRLLLNKGPVVDHALPNTGSQALHLTAQYESTDTIQELLNYRLNHRAQSGISIPFQIDAPRSSDQATPLALAVEHNNTAATRLLLQHGASLSLEQAIGAPLHRAADLCAIEATQTMLEHLSQTSIVERNRILNQPRSSDQGTPLFVAVRIGCTPIVALLLEAGADVNANHGRANQRPIVAALLLGHFALFTHLQEVGALTDDPQLMSNPSLQLLFAAASGKIEQAQTALAQNTGHYLERNFFEPRTPYSEWISPLYAAFSNGHTQLAQILVSDPQIHLKKELTIALDFKYAELIQFILQEYRTIHDWTAPLNHQEILNTIHAIDPDLHCPICTDKLATPEIKTELTFMPCGHCYCKECILPWIETQAQKINCPTCRAVFDADRITHTQSLLNED